MTNPNLAELVERLRAPDFWSRHIHGNGSYGSVTDTAPLEAAHALERISRPEATDTQEGAVERALDELVAPYQHHDGEPPEHDSPLRCVYESGVQYAVDLLAKTLKVEEFDYCDGTEEFDGDLAGTMFNIVLAAMPTDAAGDPIHPSDLPAALSSIPNAVEPVVPMTWHKGCPPRWIASEWFIAKTKYRDRVVLTSLPDEWAYDFKTADETYMLAENVIAWMQFPDSQFIPYVPEVTSITEPNAVEPAAVQKLRAAPDATSGAQRMFTLDDGREIVAYIDRLKAAPNAVGGEVVQSDEVTDALQWWVDHIDVPHSQEDFDAAVERSKTALRDHRLAHTPAAGGSSAVGIFEMGYWFGMSLRGQTMEDSRAVGRLLTADIFEPISAAIQREIDARGFDSFKDADHGVSQCKAIIHAALSSPTAGEREQIVALREALEPFAAYADPRAYIPPAMVITNGSGMARKQLTMGDCYRARTALTTDADAGEGK